MSDTTGRKCWATWKNKRTGRTAVIDQWIEVPGLPTVVYYFYCTYKIGGRLVGKSSKWPVVTLPEERFLQAFEHDPLLLAE